MGDMSYGDHYTFGPDVPGFDVILKRAEDGKPQQITFPDGDMVTKTKVTTDLYDMLNLDGKDFTSFPTPRGGILYVTEHPSTITALKIAQEVT